MGYEWFVTSYLMDYKFITPQFIAGL